MALLTLKVKPIIPNLFEAFKASNELFETVPAALEIHKNFLTNHPSIHVGDCNAQYANNCQVLHHFGQFQFEDPGN
jgi:hypothetical protein